jgi:hypothetical protein
MRWLLVAVIAGMVGVWTIDSPAKPVGRSVAAVATGVSPSPLPQRPLPPARVGCYQFSGDAWQTVMCASQRFIRRHFQHLQWQNGIASVPNGSSPAPSFVFGSIYFRFVNVGTETDSKVGSNAYSVQNNVTFTGTNGHSDGVQFAEQVRPPGPVGICIWEVDIKTQSYKTPGCVTAPGDVPLAAGDQPQVQGFIRPGNKLGLAAYVPWSTKKEYAVVAPDLYGLAGRWTNISGSVLGWGRSSHASFSSAELETIVDVSSCEGRRGTVTCPEQPTLKFHAISSASNATGETNNLTPVIGTPPGSLPTLQELAVDQADVEYVSTTTGSCPTGTSPPLCGLNSSGQG